MIFGLIVCFIFIGPKCLYYIIAYISVVCYYILTSLSNLFIDLGLYLCMIIKVKKIIKKKHYFKKYIMILKVCLKLAIINKAVICSFLLLKLIFFLNHCF